MLRPILGYNLSDLLHLRDEIIKYRLSPSQLNTVLYHLAAWFDPRILQEDVHTFHSIVTKNRRFVICPMSKDAESDSNEPTLAFIWDMVERFYNHDPDRDCILLMPLRLCRGYLKLPPQIEILKRKHAVLVEIDLQQMTIQVHDSQNRIRWSCYPDKLAEKLNKLNEITNVVFKYDPTKDYHAYDTQFDDFSCGYFVYEYIRYILKMGYSTGCEHIKFSVRTRFTDKYDFFKQHKMFCEASDSDNKELNDDVFLKCLDEWVDIKNAMDETDVTLLTEWFDVGSDSDAVLELTSEKISTRKDSQAVAINTLTKSSVVDSALSSSGFSLRYWGLFSAQYADESDQVLCDDAVLTYSNH